MSWQWIVSFNDGLQISSNQLDNGDGKNLWDKVLEHWRNNLYIVSGKKRQITHIQLVVNGRRYNSPSNSDNCSFRTLKNFEKPWIFYKKIGTIVGSAANEDYVAYSFISGECRHFFWVNMKNNFCYTQVFNVVNPKSEDELRHILTENYINTVYGELDARYISS